MHYDASCTATPVLVHPSPVFGRAGSPHEATRVMPRDALPQSVEAVRSFAGEVAQLPHFGTPQEVGELLRYHALTAAQITDKLTVPFRHKS
jgi:hypothetical protein